MAPLFRFCSGSSRPDFHPSSSLQSSFHSKFQHYPSHTNLPVSFPLTQRRSMFLIHQGLPAHLNADSDPTRLNRPQHISSVHDSQHLYISHGIPSTTTYPIMHWYRFVHFRYCLGNTNAELVNTNVRSEKDLLIAVEKKRRRYYEYEGEVVLNETLLCGQSKADVFAEIGQHFWNLAPRRQIRPPGTPNRQHRSILKPVTPTTPAEPSQVGHGR